MEFEFASSPPDLAPLVAGFAERRDSTPLGVALELPQQRALLQFILRGNYSMSRTELPSRAPPVPGAVSPSTATARTLPTVPANRASSRVESPWI